MTLLRFVDVTDDAEAEAADRCRDEERDESAPVFTGVWRVGGVFGRSLTGAGVRVIAAR